MRVLSLFAGVGMFDYAWKQLGWETVAFAEQDKWCQRVLEKHYPGVPIYDDVKDVTYDRLKQANQPTGIDLICGGFPCQDLSVAGKQAGIDGERSGLWGEFARIISEVRPKYVIVENVSALLTGDSGAWMRRVLGDLAEIGFDAEWHVIPAGNADGSKLSAGAPHRRERVWIICYPMENTRHRTGWHKRLAESRENAQRERTADTSEVMRSGNNVTNPSKQGLQECDRQRTPTEGQPYAEPQRGSGLRKDAADTSNQGLQGHAWDVVQRNEPGREPPGQDRPVTPESVLPGQDNESGRQSEPGLGLLAPRIAIELSRSGWLPEPGIGRVATGVPDRVNKLKALGNGLVWQIPYAIGRAIEQREQQ